MTLNSGVYEIVNTVNGKRYVGSSCDLRKRKKGHRDALSKGSHGNRHLQASWLRHGEAAFAFRTVIVCAKENNLLYEQIAIDALKPEFNLAPVAGSALGVKRTAEVRRKSSERMIGNQYTLGYKHGPEFGQKVSARLKGRASPTKGVERSPEAIAATASKHRGMKRSEETRAKISAARLGKKCAAPKSAEARANISAALKGKRMNQTSIDKMAATKRGQKHSEEHKARIGAAAKAFWSDPEIRAKILAAQAAARQRKKD